MIAFFRRILGVDPAPITYLNTVPASRDEERKSEIRVVHQEMTHTRVNIGQTFAELRQELAGNTLRIISGE